MLCFLAEDHNLVGEVAIGCELDANNAIGGGDGAVLDGVGDGVAALTEVDCRIVGLMEP